MLSLTGFEAIDQQRSSSDKVTESRIGDVDVKQRAHLSKEVANPCLRRMLARRRTMRARFGACLRET